MADLKRLKVGEFSIKNAVVIDDKLDKEEIERNLISIEELFKEEQKIELNNKKLILLLNGVKLSNENEDGVYKIYNLGKFIGIGIIKDNLLKRDIIL